MIATWSWQHVGISLRNFTDSLSSRADACAHAAAALAYTVAACSPNMDVANAALPTYCIMLLFFEGFLIRQPSMPVYW